jgi:hypothetical protein
VAALPCGGPEEALDERDKLGRIGRSPPEKNPRRQERERAPSPHPPHVQQQPDSGRYTHGTDRAKREAVEAAGVLTFPDNYREP